ncbi:MAG: hypothetical protein AAB511_02665 [Patescibacteria group bacterium]
MKIENVDKMFAAAFIQHHNINGVSPEQLISKIHDKQRKDASHLRIGMTLVITGLVVLITTATVVHFIVWARSETLGVGAVGLAFPLVMIGLAFNLTIGYKVGSPEKTFLEALEKLEEVGAKCKNIGKFQTPCVTLGSWPLTKGLLEGRLYEGGLKIFHLEPLAQKYCEVSELVIMLQTQLSALHAAGQPFGPNLVKERKDYFPKG